MKLLGIAVMVVAAGCGSPGNGAGGDDAGNFDARVEPDASTTLGSTFRFAIVGDTRPANEDDTAHYPVAIITKIWADIQNPPAGLARPDFAISTGDYQFSKPTGTQAAAQLDKYLAARGQFANIVYAAMGNHECTGATASNCGSGNADGITKNYTAYMAKMVQPLGFTDPYFVVNFHAADNSWTAKMVFIAANAWSSTQAAWLDQAMQVATTYTFVVRHEDAFANTAPGVTPSETIVNKYPFTLKIVGHTHTYAHYASERQVVCGNGGAPLTSGMNYGYATVERLASGAIQFTELEYMANTVIEQFRINADGSKAP